MNQGNDNSVRDATWPNTVDEIRQFLDTWYFSVSEIGHLYVRPQAATVGLNDFDTFMRRLELLQRHGYPVLTTLDFTGVEVTRVDRIRITEAVLNFASATGATAIVRPRGGNGEDVILIAMPADSKAGRPPLAGPTLMESA